jgi:hypothetical protein
MSPPAASSSEQLAAQIRAFQAEFEAAKRREAAEETARREAERKEKEAALAKRRAEEKARLAEEKARAAAKGKKRQAEPPASDRPEKKVRGEGPCTRCKNAGAECVPQEGK